MRGEEVEGNHHLRMHAHLSAPIHDLTLGMSDHAWRRCTGHATAGRRVLLNKVALNADPCGVFSTCSRSGFECFLSSAAVLATALTLRVAMRRDRCSRKQQQSESHSKCFRLSRAPFGIYRRIMSLPSQPQK